MIPRKLERHLVQLIKIKGEFNNVILLEGARQVGKTTLVRQALQENDIPFKEVNLEEKKSLSEKIDHCKDFDEFSDLVRLELNFELGGREILFIDEAQESRRLGKFVRFMKEKWKGTQVILSGSSMARIFRDDTRFPVGRVTFLHLHPFTFSEFLTASGHGADQNLNEAVKNRKISNVAHEKFLDYLGQYFEVGGLPEVAVNYFNGGNWRPLRKDILFGYYNDFKRVFGEEKQPYFIASLKSVAALLGQPFKNAYVSQLMDGGKNDGIIGSLSKLEAWKVVFNIPQKGPLPTTVFHPKKYLFDLGMIKELRDSISPDIKLAFGGDPAGRVPLGGVVENMALLGLAGEGFEENSELSGWKKSSSGSEVDFIVKWKGGVVPFECKSALSIKKSHLGGLLDYMNIYDLPLGVVVSLSPFEVLDISETRRIINLPLYLIEYWKEMI